MPRRLLVALLAMTMLVGVIACGRQQPPEVGTEIIAPADRGAPLTLSGPTLSGGTLDVASLRGRVVVLNDWASWCVPCREETPVLVTLAKQSDPSDVAVVGLNVTDDRAAAESFVEEFGVPYPSIEDRDGSLLATIPGVPPSALPSTVVLDRSGRVAARIIGAVDPAQLRTLVADVSAESAPSAVVG